MLEISNKSLIMKLNFQRDLNNLLNYDSDTSDIELTSGPEEEELGGYAQDPNESMDESDEEEDNDEEYEPMTTMTTMKNMNPVVT